MSSIHLGHHFYGAGNRGDDLMMAGFLATVPAGWKLTCAVPHPLKPLERRFPSVQWLPYTSDVRRQAVAECTAWLGLGGSPFQNGASRWFVDHLAEEEAFCAAADKPMYFLGVGGHDAAAYALPEIRRVLARATRIWTRDARTAEAIAAAAGTPARVSEAADLAHIYLASNPPPPAEPGRLTAVLNTDYAGWPNLGSWIGELSRLPARESIWAVQEERPLPGAELDLFRRLRADARQSWRLMAPPAADTPLGQAMSAWPSGEWLLSSRFHATLLGAWAGSRTVIVAINDKLRSAADETGCSSLAIDADPASLARAFADAKPVPSARLKERARQGAAACSEFFAAL